MDSVRAWCGVMNYRYEFIGDEFFVICGEDYLARVGDNKRSITNLARLELTRTRLAEGWDQVIWLDADTFIFDPNRFELALTDGYAFAREVWVAEKADGWLRADVGVHNAAIVFRGHHPDLDLLIHTIRHIVATRLIHSNYQVGTKLLLGLQYSLDFKVVAQAAMFSPDMVRAIAQPSTLQSRRILALHAKEYRFRVYAANLCWSMKDELDPDAVMRAMDILESTRGDVVNDHLTAAQKAGPAQILATEPAIWLPATPREQHHGSLAWRAKQAAARLVDHILPNGVTRALRRALILVNRASG